MDATLADKPTNNVTSTTRSLPICPHISLMLDIIRPFLPTSRSVWFRCFASLFFLRRTALAWPEVVECELLAASLQSASRLVEVEDVDDAFVLLLADAAVFILDGCRSCFIILDRIVGNHRQIHHC